MGPLKKHLLTETDGMWKEEAECKLIGFNLTEGRSVLKSLMWAGILTDDTECIFKGFSLITGFLLWFIIVGF